MMRETVQKAMNTPLGEPQKPKPPHMGLWFGLAFAVALLGVAAYGWSQRTVTKQPTVVAMKDATVEPDVSKREPEAPETAAPEVEEQSPGPSATPARPAQPVFKPRNSVREQRSPWIYIPDLIEETDDGLLPRIASDGQRPLDAYSNSPTTIGATRIAIVVSGLGLSQTGTQKAIDALPSGVTLGFSAVGNSLSRWMQVARKQGHEVALQLPMEPLGYPSVDPGRNTLLAASRTGQNIKRLRSSLGRMTNYPVVLNYLGGRFLNSREALEPVLQEIHKRGLGFLDDGSVQTSIALDLAEELKLPNAIGNVVLDANRDPAEIDNKLQSMELFARRRGFAIATATAFPETIEKIAAYVKEAEKRDIQIVPLSNLIRDYAR